MAKATTRVARIRRHDRVRKNLTGTPQRPRLNVFRSNSHMYAQVIDDTRGHTIAAASDLEPELSADVGGKSKTERAAAIGRVLADRAKREGVTAIVFDRGGYKYHGRVRALADAAREAGLEF